MKNNHSCVTAIIPGSPADRPWEGCVNSITYRVPRGVPVELPEFLAEHIKRTEAERREAEENAEKYSRLIEKIQ